MKKWMIGAGLVSTVAIGSVVFTGGDIVDQVNTKVAGMFDMLNLYESNEQILSSEIKNLASLKKELETQVKELSEGNSNKDKEIENLNAQISDLNRQIEILQGQVGNQDNLVKEVMRLEGEVNKANSKVGELKQILDREITDKPMNGKETAVVAREKVGTMNLSQDISVGEHYFNLTDEISGFMYASEGPSGYKDFNINLTNISDKEIVVGCGSDEEGSGWPLAPGEVMNLFINPSNPTKYTYIYFNDSYIDIEANL